MSFQIVDIIWYYVVYLSLSLDIQNMHLCRWFWGRGPTSRPSCVWKFNHFTNLRESTTQSYRKDDRNGVIEVEQLWFTGKLWKLIKTYWTYGSTFSSLLYFRQIHRLGKGKTGKCSNSNKKNIRPPRGVVVANGHGLECWKGVSRWW